MHRFSDWKLWGSGSYPSTFLLWAISYGVEVISSGSSFLHQQPTDMCGGVPENQMPTLHSLNSQFQQCSLLRSTFPLNVCVTCLGDIRPGKPAPEYFFVPRAAAIPATIQP